LDLIEAIHLNDSYRLGDLLRPIIDDNMSLHDIGWLTILIDITRFIAESRPQTEYTPCLLMLGGYSVYAVIYHEPAYPEQTQHKLLKGMTSRKPWLSQHELANSTLVDQITDDLLDDLIIAIHGGDHQTIIRLVHQLMEWPLTSNDIDWLITLAEIATIRNNEISIFLTEAAQQASSS